MRRILLAALATAALVIGMAGGSASAAPNPNSCHGQIVSSLAQAFGGARNAAEALIGDDPHAVQTGQQFVRAFCAS